MNRGIDTGILGFMVDDDCECPDIFTDDEDGDPGDFPDNIRFIDGDYIDQIFGPSGFLAQKFAGYEPRKAQIEIVRAIDEALTNEKNLLVEAPCGSGKSVAYLTPAIRHAIESGASRILVVTANNALSEQLIAKDLPTLRDVLPWQFEFAMAKGKGNFICRSAYDRVERTLLRVLPTSRDQIDRIDEWIVETKTGDLSELPFEPNQAIKQRLTVQSDECMGRKCDRFDSCFVESAKKRLEIAKVVVTNYHLFFADRMIRRLTDDESGVLPNADIVVMDEVDKSFGIARGFYGFELSRGQIENVAKLLVGDRNAEIPELDQDLKIRVEEHVGAFFYDLGMYAKSKEYKARLRSVDPVPWRELHQSLIDTAKAYSVASGRSDIERSPREKLRKKSLKCYGFASDLKQAMELSNENFAYFIEVDDKDRATLCGSPIDVAELLERDVWKNDEYRSVIGTSATLTTDGDFDWIRDELGAHEAEELAVDSPFDIASNMLVVVPKGIPLPNERNFQDEASRILCDAIDLAHGRTLGLFTSHRGLKSAAYFVNQRHGRKYEILVQNTMPRTKLVERKREVKSSVLLGTESFWTGVDVQGEALSLLFIDKLPFPTPDDPILDVLAERDPKGHWMKNCLPRALIAFRQGIGRLLRTTTDRGVVVICDSRIVDKPYGRAFLKACGGARVSRNLHDIGSFLDEPEKWQRDKPKAKQPKKAEPKETIRVPRGARVR
jgi:ATP-dependent DNA helicase DinG